MVTEKDRHRVITGTIGINRKLILSILRIKIKQTDIFLYDIVINRELEFLPIYDNPGFPTVDNTILREQDFFLQSISIQICVELFPCRKFYQIMGGAFRLFQAFCICKCLLLILNSIFQILQLLKRYFGEPGA